MLHAIARAAVVALGTTAAACILVAGAGERAAWAQTDAELAQARRIFAEALKDQDAKRYEEALDEFRRVQQVRDTQQVRYRIATCLEALGKVRDALAAYGSVSIAAGGDAESQRIARAARERVDELSKRAAHVVVKLGPNAPADAVVKIDGETVQGNALGTSIMVDPGAHEIVGGSANSAPFRTQVTIPEGGSATVEVNLQSAPPPPPVVPVPGPASTPNPSPASNPNAASPSTSAPSDGASGMNVHSTDDDGMNVHSSGRRTAGIVAVIGGGVLIAGGVTVAVLRHSDVATLDDACPGGACPKSRQSELTSTRDRALAEGPIAIAAGAVGVAAVGVGVWLLLTSDDAPAHTAGLAPWLARDGGGVVWRRSF